MGPGVTDWRRWVPLAAAACLLLHGCSREVELRAPPTDETGAAASPAPTDAAEPGEAADQPRPLEEVDPGSAERPQIDTTVLPAPRPQAQVAAMVHGAAEIEAPGGRFIPAEYFRVTLSGRGGDFETLTTRGGEFYLERVPAGTYVLELSMPKGPSVYTDTVSITASETVTLPDLHVPLEEYERRRR